MDKIIWIIAVIISGAILPVQAGLNAKMGKAIESPVMAALVSFSVGTIALLIYAGLTKSTFQADGLKNVPWYTWLAGAIGAFYVTVVLLAFPKLGPALTFGLIVGGQLLISLFLDHFNILVAQQHSINVYRVLGMILIVAGVVMIRKY